MPIRKVLLATDGSPNAQSGLEILLSWPWCSDTSFEVVTVADKIAGVGHLNVSEATALAEATAEKLKSVYGSERVGTNVLGGHAVDLILKVGQAEKADLLVIGAHSKHGPLETLTVGNVAHNLAARSQTSIIIARANSNSKLGKILLCLDCAETAQRLIEAALNFAPGTEFLLLHIFQPPLSEYGPSQKEDMRFFHDAETKARAQSEAFLNDSAAMLRTLRPHNEVMTMLIEDFFIARQIVDICHKWEADVVVLGSVEQKGDSQHGLGSISKEVLWNVLCSVQIAKRSSAGSVNRFVSKVES